MIRVTIWNENVHDREDDRVKELYPEGLHGAIRDLLKSDEELEITLTTLDAPEFGMPDELLNNTDVLIWWGHVAHEQLPWEIADKVADRVHRGMGFIGLHSAHLSRPFTRLMGTSCSLRWLDDTREHVWCTDPTHPIAKGIPAVFTLEKEEMYGEFFDIPKPDSVVFTGWFSTGNVFRSGCTFSRGHGKMFYFQPGHETNPTYKNEIVGQILRNAVRWAAPQKEIFDEIDCPWETEYIEKKYQK